MFRSLRWFFPIFALFFVIISRSALQKNQKNSLVLFGWPNCFSTEVLREFEKEFDCQVIYSSFDSNEAMYTKIKNGAFGYDLILCSSSFVELMRDQDLLLQLDHSKLPNISYIDEGYMTFSSDPKMMYSIPQMISILGIGFDEKRVPQIPESWFVFSDWKQFKRRMTLLNDPKDVIGAALLALGYDHNSTNLSQINKAKDLLFEWKSNIAIFSSEPYIGLESGEFVLSQAYLGGILKAQRAKSSIGFVVPKEGSILSFEDLVILKSSQQHGLAFSFINFILKPEHTARNVSLHLSFMPHKELDHYLDSKFLQTFEFYYKKIIKTTKFPKFSWLKENEKLYFMPWEEVQSN